MGRAVVNSYIIVGAQDADSLYAKVFLDNREGETDMFFKFFHDDESSKDFGPTAMASIKSAASVSQASFDSVCTTEIGAWYTAVSSNGKATLRGLVNRSVSGSVKCKLHRDDPYLNVGSALVAGVFDDILDESAVSSSAFSTEMSNHFPTWWGNRTTAEKAKFFDAATGYDAL